MEEKTGTIENLDCFSWLYNLDGIYPETDTSAFREVLRQLGFSASEVMLGPPVNDKNEVDLQLANIQTGIYIRGMGTKGLDSAIVEYVERKYPKIEEKKENEFVLNGEKLWLNTI